MIIEESLYKKMPPELQAMFRELPNPGSKEVVEIFPGEEDKSAAQFFYVAKASKSERNMGLEMFEPQITNDGRQTPIDNAFQRGETKRQNHHPTVKPLALMEYLIKLASKPGQIVLDPFAGSGTTCMAAKKLGRQYIGIEKEKEYWEIAVARVAYTQPDKEEPNQLQLAI